jgi:methyl-accepting chemotaxis protein
MTSQDFMWIALGASALIVAIGLAFALFRLGGVFGRTDDTLGKVEQLLDSLQAPTTRTLDSVSGVAGNIDAMVGRIDRLTQTLEQAASGIAKAADKAQTAVSPAVANVVGMVAGISKGAQSFFRSRHNGASRE